MDIWGLFIFVFAIANNALLSGTACHKGWIFHLYKMMPASIVLWQCHFIPLVALS